MKRKLLLKINRLNAFVNGSKIFILLAAILYFHSPMLAQDDILNTPVSITKENTSLEEILKELEENYSFYFSYTHNILPEGLKISVNLTEQPLQLLLDQIFRNTEIIYLVTEKHIILIHQPRSPVLSPPGKRGYRRGEAGRNFKPKSASSFSAGLDAVIGTSFRNLTSPSSEGNTIISWRKNEKPKAGFSLELSGVYHFRSGFFTGTGIGILNVGETGSNTFSKYSDRCSERYRFNYYDDDDNHCLEWSHSLKYVNSYTYLTIPVFTGYQFKFNRLTVGFQTGLFSGILLGTAESLEYYNYFDYYAYSNLSRRRQSLTKPPLKADYRSFVLGYSFQGLFMYATSKFSFLLGPSYKHLLSSVYKNKAPLKENPYLLGITAGIKYRF